MAEAKKVALEKVCVRITPIEKNVSNICIIIQPQHLVVVSA